MPSKLMCTVSPPVVTVKSLFVLSALLTVSENVITSPLDVRVTLALKVTAPV